MIYRKTIHLRDPRRISLPVGLGNPTKRRSPMIPKINKILYATDLSENSAYALRYAVNSAKQHDADLVVLHVMEMMDVTTLSLMMAYAGNKYFAEKGDGK